MKARAVLLALVGLVFVRDAVAQEAWCTNNGANCVCTENFQSPSYNRVVDYGNGGSFLATQINAKQCRVEGATTSIESVFGSNVFDNSLLIVNDPTATGLLAPSLLPNKQSVVQRYLRHAGDSTDALQNTTYRFGHDAISLGTTTKRISMRWYVYYSPNFEWSGDPGCTNGKIGHFSSGFFTTPRVTMTYDGGPYARAYDFLDNFGWNWTGGNSVSGFDGFATVAPRAGSALDNHSTRGRWLRYEMIFRRPRIADQATLGADWELWVTDVTNGTPPHQEMRLSAGCSACIKPSPETNFTWSTTVQTAPTPSEGTDGNMNCVHTEYYRAGACLGWQAWLYAVVAKWDVDCCFNASTCPTGPVCNTGTNGMPTGTGTDIQTGPMIGAASEMEGGAADTTPPSRTAGTPSGSLASGTTSTSLSLTTDEAATCKYSTTAGTAYASMTNTFSTTGGTSHSTTVTGLSNGTSYTYYVRCSDGVTNVNTTDTVAGENIPITFSVAAAGSIPATVTGARLIGGILK